MRKVYICSPYRGDTEKNIERAKGYCRQAVNEGCIPIAPHLYFPQFLNDDDEEERRLGFEMGFELFHECLEVWVCGDIISEGMREEIAYAEHLGRPIVLKK